MEINTLIEMIELRAQDSGEKIAFTFEGQPTSFQTIWQGVNQFASYLLNKELAQKERVVIALPNGAEFFFAFYGVQRAGGIAVPLFPDSSAERIASIAKSCEASSIVLPESSLKRGELEAKDFSCITFSETQKAELRINYPEIQPDDIAFLQYTSGSTGNPKGVMLTHANLLTNMRQMIAGMQITQEDIFVSWLPIYHDMGLILMTLVPFYLAADVVAGYGLAEATVGVSMWTPQTPARVDANGLVSVGHPFPDVELKILKDDPSSQIGEIMIKSAANSKGYLHNPAETKALFWKDGYIHSGDLGYLDENGYLYIVGRRKNIIKHAGETIAPQEIEETVDAISGVRMSAAVGIDRGRVEGEQAYVFVEVREKPNISEWGYELTVEIVQAIHDRLGIRPARVVLVKPHTIPKTHNGKVQHVRLRESYLDGTLRAQGKILYPEY